jgi:hypothetical protein
MAEDWDRTKWEQLNLRSRWYSGQLWYVPFAFVGVVGLIFDNILKLAYPLNSFGFIFIGLLSLAVVVHIMSLRHYELKAVSNMRKLEQGDKISSGGSQWFLSFSLYIKFIVCLTSLFLIGYGLYLIKMIAVWLQILLWFSLFLVFVFYIFLFWKDYSRNKPVLKDIRDPK